LRQGGTKNEKEYPCCNGSGAEVVTLLKMDRERVMATPSQKETYMIHNYAGR
jgi:hypothetical protein